MAPSSKKNKSSTVTATVSSTSHGASGDGITSSGVNGTASGKRILILKVRPAKLRAILDPNHTSDDDDTTKDAKEKASPATSATLPVAPNSTAENGSDSNPNTPAAGTPAPQAGTMGPPTEGPKKKGGNKRGAAAINGGEPKVRGKPGPKKKIRLEDGTVEGGRGTGLGAHKLGPKANQGAINAGLRALDRTGKPCRKWTKAGFTLKSFTGVVWEINRWSAPPKPKPETASAAESATVSAEGSSKENKENGSQVKSENSNNGADVEMTSAPPSVGAAPSPAPAPAVAV